MGTSRVFHKAESDIERALDPVFVSIWVTTSLFEFVERIFCAGRNIAWEIQENKLLFFKFHVCLHTVITFMFALAFALMWFTPDMFVFLFCNIGRYNYYDVGTFEHMIFLGSLI